MLWCSICLFIQLGRHVSISCLPRPAPSWALLLLLLCVCACACAGFLSLQGRVSLPPCLLHLSQGTSPGLCTLWAQPQCILSDTDAPVSRVERLRGGAIGLCPRPGCLLRCAPSCLSVGTLKVPHLPDTGSSLRLVSGTPTPPNHLHPLSHRGATAFLKPPLVLPVSPASLQSHTPSSQALIPDVLIRRRGVGVGTDASLLESRSGKILYIQKKTQNI